MMERARARLGEREQGTILFLDEIHRFNKAQQDALLPERRGRPADADRRHHREPVLRGQPAAALPVDAVPARAARPRRAAHAGRAGAGGRGRHRRRRRARPPGRPVGRRRPPAAHRPRGRGRPGHRAAAAAPAVRERRRRADALGARPPLRPRRPLRRDLGLHQEHPRLRSRRRALLAGPHAGGGRGRPLHRPPPGDPGLRGRRHGRPDGAGRGRSPPPARSSSSACPRPSSTWPRPSCTWPRRRRATGPRSASGRPARTCARAGWARCRPTCATATTAARASLGHGEGYEYPHDDPRGWVPQQLPARRGGRPALLRAVPPRLRGGGGPPPERGGDEGEAPQDRRTARPRSAGPRADRFRRANDPTGRLLGGAGRVRSCGDRRGAGHRARDGAVRARLRGLVVVLVRVLQALQELRAEVEDLRAETGPLLDELRRPSTRRATTSSASTGCSARPRPSRPTCRASPG